MDTFKEIVNIIKTPENYVPRDYQTVGGMWTVDTWKKGEVTYQLMDEGYTRKILAPDIDVIEKYDGTIEFTKGSVEDLDKLLATLMI